MITDNTFRELLSYLHRLAEDRLKEPKDDLISKLMTEQVKTGKLDTADAVQMAFLLLVAGNATMVNMIALVRSSPYLISSLIPFRRHRTH